MTRSSSLGLNAMVYAALVLLGVSRPALGAADTFVGDGVVLSDPTRTQDDIHALVTSGGHAFAVGMDAVPGDGEWRIEKRSLGDGSLVPAFGVGGVIQIDPSSGWDFPTAATTDGSYLYVVGQHGRPQTGYADHWRIEKRAQLDGALATGFGSGGAVTDTGNGGRANAVATDGTFLYVAGGDANGWRIEKRSVSNGVLGTSFGAGGIVTAGTGEALGVAIDESSMVVVGTVDWVQWRIERRNLSDGTLVYGVTEPFAYVGCGEEGALAVAVDATSAYISGSAAGGWRVEKRRLADGSLLYAQSLPGSGSCDAARTITIDASFMYVGGGYGGDFFNGWRVERRALADGSLAAGFGSGGVVTSPAFGSYEAPVAVCIDGEALFVGGISGLAGPDTQWRIEKRALSTGALVTKGATTTTTTLPPDDGGFVPPNGAVASCERAVAVNVGHLAAAIIRCHRRSADAASAGKAFDEETCETTARSRYDELAARLLAAGTCPACVFSAAPTLGDTVESTLDALNAGIYCAGTVSLP